MRLKMEGGWGEILGKESLAKRSFPQPNQVASAKKLSPNVRISVEKAASAIESESFSLC